MADEVMLTIRMPRELKERLELLAKEDNRSMTKYIVTVLQEHLKQGEQQ